MKQKRGFFSPAISPAKSLRTRNRSLIPIQITPDGKWIINKRPWEERRCSGRGKKRGKGKSFKRLSLSNRSWKGKESLEAYMWRSYEPRGHFVTHQPQHNISENGNETPQFPIQEQLAAPQQPQQQTPEEELRVLRQLQELAEMQSAFNSRTNERNCNG
ncbi:hypothetical protein BDK51DRAFT_31092 [Blyttiomyces helicus]|uniref:Uncharacterized protein n=1 Tax=Blyttiomyces helicus TaxID=388810 RepID=A0A4P9W4B9_9FUNG|nr:hypothetical protein BDK51DRAFT_31092 [Blyttiomyces helicus]|eukprot:RKO87034.1 hypothetical protein BDK51DRAFT_31092 [Blyttiomyces helicus]